jgi:hypothetical protein
VLNSLNSKADSEQPRSGRRTQPQPRRSKRNILLDSPRCRISSISIFPIFKYLAGSSDHSPTPRLYRNADFAAQRARLKGEMKCPIRSLSPFPQWSNALLRESAQRRVVVAGFNFKIVRSRNPFYFELGKHRMSANSGAATAVPLKNCKKKLQVLPLHLL